MADKNSLNGDDSACLGKLRRLMPEWIQTANAVRGFLVEKEMKFLAMAAACPTAAGVILEVGSFMGKSTTILALASQLAPGTQIVAVDPLILRIPGNKDSWLAEFKANLRNAKVEHLVEFHRMPSQQLGPLWNRDRKIRLLWIDANHSYEGVKGDFDLFFPFLADGAIVALHDCFRHEIGPMRVFAEDMLLSKNFGAAGACGSIGWAQFRADPKDCTPSVKAKLQLYKRITRLIAYVYPHPPGCGIHGVGYKLIRSRIPHGEIDPADWLGQVALCGGQRGKQENLI
jgi:predicted O-methyltransferase YrrM